MEDQQKTPAEEVNNISEQENVQQEAESSELENKVKEEIKEEQSLPVKSDTDDASPEEVHQTDKDRKEPVVEGASEDTESEEQDDSDEEDNVDFEHMDKAQLVEFIMSLKNESDMRKLDRLLKSLRARFDEIFDEVRQAALEKFLEDEGASEDDFEFKGDELDVKFNDYYGLLRDRRNDYFKNLEKEKDDNLKKKEELLDKIRSLVDGEESNVSINALRALQDEWKAIGPVPAAYNRTLWANYHALLDRFYDARSIYFELKELDRKKNYDQKVELCEKAEALAKQDNVKDAVIQLNELHEEYKHLGPVPKELQEDLWTRFKAASDAIYAKRKDFVEALKDELNANLEKKMALIEKIKEFSVFSSESISEWNSKTRDLLAIQKEWEAIGGIPRAKAKEINKTFWSTFKSFFNAKNQFFKTQDSKKEDNLKLKEELVEKAESLKESTKWDQTAEAFKNLQQEWRDIGPVPDKVRNQLYKRFKSACDQFFNNRRAANKQMEASYEENLSKKLELCDKIDSIAKEKSFDLEAVYELVDDYMDLGFVPKKSIKKVHRRFDEVMQAIMGHEHLSEEDQNEFRIQIQVNKLKSSPHGNNKLNRKEQSIRRKIQTIENDINTYKTNIEFFASSKTADKLRAEMDQKIEASRDEISQLKKQLKMLRDA